MYYFASDMHLAGPGSGPDAAARERLLASWLESCAKDAEAIYLLGDVFDFWFEYEHVAPKGFTRTLATIGSLTERGIEVHFFPGNHDMWTVGYLEQECGLIVHRRAEVVELYGKRLFLAHGDNIGRRTAGERFLNGFFRNRTAKWLFERLIHPDLAMRFGHWWSRKSRKSSRRTAYTFWEEREPLVQYARAMGGDGRIDCFIFGHLHHCVDYRPDEALRAIFLGDWIDNPSFAALAPDGAITLNRL
ncbi:MAG: UDP-2,3-diacylglucosamine diphosphatase [Rikenellaceae bacterium]|jgi:UDP-2,3-diacylglucosamine hydrolase|nr:UDP-2,3-diacylglucosamine diphosphatase [Rikenellaceae bacterium]